MASYLISCPNWRVVLQSFSLLLEALFFVYLWLFLPHAGICFQFANAFGTKKMTSVPLCFLSENTSQVKDSSFKRYIRDRFLHPRKLGQLHPVPYLHPRPAPAAYLPAPAAHLPAPPAHLPPHSFFLVQLLLQLT